MPQDSSFQAEKSGKIKRSSSKAKNRNAETGSYQRTYSQSETDTTADPIIPQSARVMLRKLFSQIEKEFEVLYAENAALREKVERLLAEKEGYGERSLLESNELDVTAPLRSSSKKNSQQKLKTAYKLKAQTSKIVSSFKTPPVNCSFVKEFKGHRDGIWDVSVADCGKPWIATASADHTARVWNRDTGECLMQYAGHTGSVNSIQFHPNSDLIVTASGDQTCHIWQAASVIWDIKHRADEEDLEKVKEEDYGGDGCVTLQTPKRSFTGHSNAAIAVDWLPGGDQIISASWDRTALLYDVETGELLQTLSGHDQELMHASAHHSQKLVVTSSKDTTFRLWDFREPIHSVSVFQGHTQSVTSAVFTKNSDDKVVSGSDDRTVKVWDLRNMRSSLVTIRSDSGINRLAVSSSDMMAIPHDNRQVRIFDLTGQRVARLPRTSRQGHRRMVCGVAWNEESATCNFFSCGFDRMIFGWLIQPNRD